MTAILRLILRHPIDEANSPAPEGSGALGLDATRSPEQYFDVQGCSFVLAGGKSRRMGRDKAALEFRGRTLLQHSLDTLETLGLPVFVLVSREDSFRESAGRELIDAVEDGGPLGAICGALRTASPGFAVVLACDLPLVPPALLEKLIEEQGDGFDVVVPVDSGDRLHPLCGVYGPRCLGEAERLVAQGKLGVQDLCYSAALTCRRLRIGMLGYGDEILLNVNTPEDLERMRRFE